MAKVRILGLRSERAAIIAAIHRLGVLEVPLALEVAAQGATTPRYGVLDREGIARVESAIQRLAALEAQCPQPEGERGDPPGEWPTGTDVLAEAMALLGELEPVVERLKARRAALEIELGSLQRQQDLVQRLLPLAGGIVDLEGVETVALIIQPAFRYVVEALRESLTERTQGQYEIIENEAPDGSVAALLVFSRRFAREVQDLLRGEQLTEARLPPQYHGRPFHEALRDMAHREASVREEVAALQGQLERTLRPHTAAAASWRRALDDRLDELRIVGRGIESDYTFSLAGWAPERELPTLERGLRERFDERVALERLSLSRSDWAEMPVLMENPRWARPFEPLVALLSPPRYGTIDPTPYLAFFFPLFFGLILGDIGYGGVVLGISAWLQRRTAGPPWVQPAARILGLGALMAMAFGVAYGEFFGDLGHRIGLRPLIIDRTGAIQPLLLFSVALGAAQVSLGLVLGVINSNLEQQGKEALSKAATLMGLVAVFVLAGVAARLLPAGLLTPGLALLAGACAVLVYSLGLVGPLEVFGVAGNVLSYTRLVALGLSSVILAGVANEMAGRTGSILLGVIVGVLFHGLNLALGLFSPSIQSLRLQYVEFFGHFFQPGGRPYVPFRCRVRAAEG